MTPATVSRLFLLGSCCFSFLEDLKEFGQEWFNSQLRRSPPSVKAGIDARISPGEWCDFELEGLDLSFSGLMRLCPVGQSWLALTTEAASLPQISTSPLTKIFWLDDSMPKEMGKRVLWW